MKVILTGGGTGGHIYPALSIADELRSEDKDAEILFVGSRHGPEGRLAERAGLRFVGLPSKHFGGKLSLSNIGALATLALAVPRAMGILSLEQPDVVIGTGGYTSAAVMLAQSLRRGPSLIHEQNAIPGRTNLFLSRFVSVVCVTYAESASYFRAKKVEVTGLPIRRDIATPRDKAVARTNLGLRPDLFTVLVLGGSQGARKLNALVAQAAGALRGQGIQILHQSGEANYKSAVAAAPSGLDLYHIAPYFDDPTDAYWAADLIVSRSGASTLAELTAVGLPAILVPYPFAYANHQEKNARLLEDRGAAVIIEEAAATGADLANEISSLKRDPERLGRMAEASRGLARPDAAERVIDVARRVASNE